MKKVLIVGVLLVALLESCNYNGPVEGTSQVADSTAVSSDTNSVALDSLRLDNSFVNRDSVK
jgi:hypothetical protein